MRRCLLFVDGDRVVPASRKTQLELVGSAYGQPGLCFAASITRSNPHKILPSQCSWALERVFPKSWSMARERHDKNSCVPSNPDAYMIRMRILLIMCLMK